jgi:predicted enzyme related to lactoylglutathione lyase
MLYLPVADLDESLRRVTEGGGSVFREPRRAEGGHAYAVIRDPVGAWLALVPA